MNATYYRNLAADCLKLAETAREQSEHHLRMAALAEAEARVWQREASKCSTDRPPCGSEPDLIEVEEVSDVSAA